MLFLFVSKLKGLEVLVKRFLSLEDYKKQQNTVSNLINNFRYENHIVSIKGKELFYKGKVFGETLTLIVCNRLQIKTPVRPDYQSSKTRP